MIPWPLARRAVSWLVVAAAVVVVVVGVTETLAADPRQGEGWIGGPLQLVLLGAPLVVVGLGLRSRRRTVARRTALAAAGFAALGGTLLTAQWLDPNEIARDRLLSAFGVVVYLAVAAVEWPAFTRRWPGGPTRS